MTKRGLNNLWKCVTVKYVPCYLRKVPVLMQNTHTCKKKKIASWMSTMSSCTINTKRHVTKLECYPLWEMSLHQNNNVWQLNVLEYRATEFPEDINTPGLDGRTDHPPPHTHTHARTHARMRAHDSQCWQVSVIVPFEIRFPETTKQVEKVSYKHSGFRHTHTHTHTHTHAWLSELATLCCHSISETFSWNDREGGED
jgi:hypothetical protein